MQLLATIDALLRGRLTRREDLAAGRIEVPVGTLAIAALAMGAMYGVAMGLFAPLRSVHPSWEQLLATTLKVPLLFLLTLVVTYPSLYVVSALFDSRLRHAATLKLLLGSMGVNLALLASLAPVMAFFTLCTDSYAFMVVLNVVFFAIAGFVGLAFLRRALNSVFEVERQALHTPPPPPLQFPESATDVSFEGGSPDRRYRPALGVPAPQTPATLRVFTIWTIIYGIVGAQMGWILRPFVGAPNLPFELFRSERQSNFFEAFFHALGKLLT